MTLIPDDKLKSLNEAFWRTTKGDLTTLGAVKDVAAAGADCASGLPIVTILRKGWQAVSVIPNYLFLRKIVGFLQPLETIPQEKRQKQIEKLAAEPGYQEQTGEAILLYLDHANHFNKPGMMGRVFAARLAEKITESEFCTLNHTIDAIHVGAIPEMKDFYSGSMTLSIGPSVMPSRGQSWNRQHLATCGLLDFPFTESAESMRGRRVQSSKDGFKANRIGQLFWTYARKQ